MNFLSIIHPEGWRFVGIFVAVTFLVSLLSQFGGWVCFILTFWCFYFFRNPRRVTPDREGLVISPADGKIVAIKQVVPPESSDMGNEPLTRISIFLNIFDVHINRIPISGTIESINYHAGRFLNASLDKASEHNERNTIVVNSEFGKVAFVQIAGLIARRIRCDVEEGNIVKTGSQYGIIRFGSRMDIYLPKELSPLVCVGQRAVGGETILADFKSNESPRTGQCVESI
jgi:phosphatidylserine decarboxylase